MQKKIANLCRLILSDTNTRNLFFFLLLNFFFAFVELAYGLLTNSLGLISDSFHMFFDCSALVLGLAASIITKWKPNEKFTYGFGRAEILAGLANGLFLLFIALFIMKEAVERAFEPPEVHHERLFIISVLGFIVNLVGIFVFQHGGQGHHHGHGGCSHSHSHPHSIGNRHNHSHAHDHAKHDHSNHHHHYSSPTYYDKYASNNNGSHNSGDLVALDMNAMASQEAKSNSFNRPNDNHSMSPPFTQYPHEHHDHGHSHGHGHHDNHHDHEPLLSSTSTSSGSIASGGRGQIMQSVFLHIVADTLGSVGVIISAVLMNQFGWMIADPICSIFIASMIGISVYPLLRDSFYILMQRTPVELEGKLPGCFYKVQHLQGVLSIQETHFWTLNSDFYVGSIKVEASNDADTRYLLATIKAIFNQVKVQRIHIQIDQV